MNQLGCDQLREMLLTCTDRIIKNEPYLTKADSRIGDGDHGIGMRKGMEAARRFLAENSDETNVYAILNGMALAMRDAMGGASGMIFSSLFAGDASTQRSSDTLSPNSLLHHLEKGLIAIQEIGHAHPGDKTMVDALFPAIEAMKQNNSSFVEMMSAASDAARDGVEKSKSYVARFGRAKNLGERVIGYPDAGAVSTWLIFLAMKDYFTGETSPDPVLSNAALNTVESEAVSPKKKIINDPSYVVKEETEGFLAAFGEDIAPVDGVSGLVRKKIPDGKTALLIGGGSGHEPMFGFFLGENLADAAANGNIFASPDPKTIYLTAKAAERGGGILFLYGNYAGDNLNFDKAAEMLAQDGIPVKTIRVMDDVASAPRDRMSDRRGIAGDVLMVKIAGAACTTCTLEEAYRISARARDNLYTIGVGLAGATIPGQTEPIFSLPPDEMEYGLGIHGEPGVRRMKMQSADEITTHLLTELLKDSGIREGDIVCSYVNGLGSTTMMELMIINRKLSLLLQEQGIIIHDMDVGSFVTTLEMAGASISLMRMDDELIRYYDLPCRSPYYTRPFH